MNLSQTPIAKAQMLIRRPVAEVFNAFVDPAVTTRFWFTKSSGKLEEGKQVEWAWEMYGFSIPVDVKTLEPNSRIVIEWHSANGPTTVEWIFTPHGDDATFVTITNSGFGGDGDEIVNQAIDSTGGFNLLLAGLKAFLEHNISLNLVADHAPH